MPPDRQQSRLAKGGSAEWIDPERSTFTISRTSILLRAELHLREAGRFLELSINPEIQRTARLAFRLASRCRSDRLAAVA